MPRTRSLAFTELKLGILALVALILAGILIFAVGGGGFFWQQYPLKTRFPNVASIKSGSPVRISGIEKGSVTRVEISGTGADVWFTVENEMRPLVTTASRATIGSISLLGEGAVDLTPAAEGTPLQDWQYVPTGTAAGTIAELTEQANSGLNEARLLLEDLRAGKGTMGRLFTDDSVYRNLDALVTAAERVTRTVVDGDGSLARFSRDPRVYDELRASLENLNALTASVRNGDGSLGQLLTDPALARSLAASSANLETMTGRLSKGEGTMGRLLTDDALYRRLDEMTGRLDTLIGQLGAGQGTAGQLLQDKQLYENMNQAAAELRGLIGDIRKDPKKYLNLKVSIF